VRRSNAAVRRAVCFLGRFLPKLGGAKSPAIFSSGVGFSNPTPIVQRRGMNVMLRPRLEVEESPEAAWLQEIERRVGSRTFQAGLRYSRQGRVSNIAYAPDGGSVTARTRGSASRPYGQRITLKRRADDGLDFTGQCSCPVGYNCKHVAAVLIGADPARLGEADPDVPRRLPDHYTGWLKELERAAAPESEEYPASVADRLFYVVAEEAGRPGMLRIEPRSARQNKDGNLGQERKFDPERVLHLRCQSICVRRTIGFSAGCTPRGATTGRRSRHRR
jgi:hypothetical protein